MTSLRNRVWYEWVLLALALIGTAGTVSTAVVGGFWWVIIVPLQTADKDIKTAQAAETANRLQAIAELRTEREKKTNEVREETDTRLRREIDAITGRMDRQHQETMREVMDAREKIAELYGEVRVPRLLHPNFPPLKLRREEQAK